MNSFSLIKQVQFNDREVQTNIEIEDVLNYKLRDFKSNMDKKKLYSLEERLVSFQLELERKNEQELQKQVISLI